VRASTVGWPIDAVALRVGRDRMTVLDADP
jgi:hypothetical protein